MSFIKSDQTAKQFIEAHIQESMSEAEQLAEDIKNTFYKYFPKSKIYGGFRSGLGESISLTFTLGADKSEYTNGIEHNDPMRALIFIYGMDREGNLIDPLEMTGEGWSVTVESTEPHLAYGRVKVPFRKTTGDSKKILQAVDRGFSRLYDTVKANKDKIEVPFDINKKL